MNDFWEFISKVLIKNWQNAEKKGLRDAFLKKKFNFTWKLEVVSKRIQIGLMWNLSKFWALYRLIFKFKFIYS